MTLTEEQKDYIDSISHPDMVGMLCKPGQDILDGLTPGRAHTLHMAVGIAGEAGELLDAIKKYAIYCKPVDRENVVEELGDLEFYMEGLRTSFNISRSETLTANKLKLLGKRYASGKYSDEQAIQRADKSDAA
jgi:NTP pyrophosphatase (non-canonical NTP hydrolase)